jgi:hypothetical protein
MFFPGDWHISKASKTPTFQGCAPMAIAVAVLFLAGCKSQNFSETAEMKPANPALTNSMALVLDDAVQMNSAKASSDDPDLGH